MGARVKVGSKRSACLYIDGGVLKTARRMGLNVSKVSENALKEAIRRLGDSETGTGLLSRPRLEGRGRDSNPGVRLHRPAEDQETPDDLLDRFYDFCRVDL